MTLDEYQQAAAETRSPFTHAGKGVIPGARLHHDGACV